MCRYVRIVKNCLMDKCLLSFFINRFFGPPPEEEEEQSEESEENGLSMDPASHESIISHTPACKMETSDNEESSDDEKLVKAEWAYGDAERSTSKRLSALDKLQAFRRNDQATIPGSRIKQEADKNAKLSQNGMNEMTEGVKQESEDGVKMEEGMVSSDLENETEMKASSNSLLSNQSSKATPKGRLGAFSWNRSSRSRNSGKDKKKVVSMSLDMFRRPVSSGTGNSSKLKWNREDGSVDVNDNEESTRQSQRELEETSKESYEQSSQFSNDSQRLPQSIDQDSQGSISKFSYSADLSQSSNLYSLDADALSYSQLGVSRNNTLSNSQNISQDQSQDLESQGEAEEFLAQSQGKGQDALELEESSYSIQKLPSLENTETSQESSNSTDTNSGGLLALPKLPSIPGLEIDKITHEKSTNNENSGFSLESFSTGKTSSNISSTSHASFGNSTSPSTPNDENKNPKSSSLELFDSAGKTSSNFYSVATVNLSKSSSSLKRRDSTKKKRDITSKLSSYFSRSDETKDDSQEEDCVEDARNTSSSDDGDKNGGVEGVIDLTDEDGSDGGIKENSGRKVSHLAKHCCQVVSINPIHHT